MKINVAAKEAAKFLKEKGIKGSLIPYDNSLVLEDGLLWIAVTSDKEISSVTYAPKPK